MFFSEKKKKKKIIENTLYFMLFKMLLVVWFFYALSRSSPSCVDQLIACLYFIYSIFRHVCDLRTISFKMGDMYKKKSEVHSYKTSMNERMSLSLNKIKFDLEKCSCVFVWD